MQYDSAIESDYTSTRNPKTAETFDLSLFFATILLIACGLISIYSATFYTGLGEFFNKQLQYAGVGLICMVVVAYLPERWLFNLSYIGFIVGLVLLAAVLTPLGKEVYGSRSWIALGTFTFQPAELVKFATIAAVARYLSQKGSDISTVRDAGITLLMFGLPIALIMAQPDFGSASVFIALSVGMALWAGLDLYFLFIIVGAPAIAISAFWGQNAFYVCAGILSAFAIWFRRGIIVTIIGIAVLVGAGFSSGYVYGIMKPHQKARIQTFLNPDSDPKGRGYNVIQSILAVGSGGFTGKGFLQGTQTQLRYIPKQWTDFIFCVPTEEFGFIGGVIILFFMGTIIYRCVDTATTATSRFGSLLSFGVATMFFYHVLVNVGMAIGWFPVMGIPLPFMSAGGTSLVINMVMIGAVLNVHRQKALRRKGV
jgi:rod shape determining protein RodA